jgi:hypothetical protein
MLQQLLKKIQMKVLRRNDGKLRSLCRELKNPVKTFKLSKTNKGG